MPAIYKGDDTNAFGNQFIKIYRPEGTEDFTITKAIVQCGSIQKVYTNPQFPIYVDFTHNETKKLKSSNDLKLQVFDEKGLRVTCKGTLTFTTEQQVVQDEFTTRI